MGFGRLALRIAALLQALFGGAMAILAIDILRESWPPGRHWASMAVILLLFAVVVGLTLFGLALALWRRSMVAWWASILIVGGLLKMALMLQFFPAVAYLACNGLLLVLGWPALFATDADAKRA